MKHLLCHYKKQNQIISLYRNIAHQLDPCVITDKAFATKSVNQTRLLTVNLPESKPCCFGVIWLKIICQFCCTSHFRKFQLMCLVSKLVYVVPHDQYVGPSWDSQIRLTTRRRWRGRGGDRQPSRIVRGDLRQGGKGCQGGWTTRQGDR